MIKLEVKQLRYLNIRAITILFFVLFEKKKDFANKKLVNHERIHIKQQIETLFIPFLVWYYVEYVVRYFQYKDWNKAYRNISFEREAYANEGDLEYIKSRKWWSWRNYL